MLKDGGEQGCQNDDEDESQIVSDWMGKSLHII